MKESYIERSCVKFAKLLGIESIKLSIQSNVGYPDRLFFIPGGVPLFVEFKIPGGKLSKKQELIIDQLKEIGYNVHVCDSLDGFKQTLRESIR